MSFVVGRGPLIMPLKQVELLPVRINMVFKQNKILDSLILQLQMLVEVFKAQKVTLFIIDEDLQ
jgi:hypothetical protein